MPAARLVRHRSVRHSAAVVVTGVVSSLCVAVVAAAPAAATDVTPRELTITVTGLGPENRTCTIDADL